jgi:hypothetical protein
VTAASAAAVKRVAKCAAGRGVEPGAGESLLFTLLDPPGSTTTGSPPSTQLVLAARWCRVAVEGVARRGTASRGSEGPGVKLLLLLPSTRCCT